MTPLTTLRPLGTVTALRPTLVCPLDDGSGFRTVSNLIHATRLQLGAQWAQLASEALEHLLRHNKVLEVGGIDALHWLERGDVRALGNAFFEALGWPVRVPDDAEHQVLYCRGAPFHHDYTFWSNQVFLTVYLAGPEADFVLPHAGHRQTLRPGDAFLFDPAAPHGLLAPGQCRFEPSAWPEGEPADTWSFFASIDLDLTEELDERFGIERARSRTELGVSILDISDPSFRLCRKSGKHIRRRTAA